MYPVYDFMIIIIIIARFWSEIETFSYPVAFNAPVGVFPLEFRENVSSSEN